MVNTVHFAQAAGGGVATVSRAVVLVGFAGIRNMALSVVLMEHMSDKAHAALLKEEFLRSLMAGTLARELTPVVREGEDAFLGSMFQNLGRLLTEYYFPEEGMQIRQQLFSMNANTSGTAREAAARKVLGLGFSDIGMGVAKAWGLPDTLQRAMTAPDGDMPSRLLMPGVERSRWVGRAANALTDALLNDEGAAQQQALQEVAEQSAPMLGLMAKDIVAIVHEARSKLASLAQAMNLHIARGSPARRLIDSHHAAPAAQKVAAAADTDADAAPATESTSASGRLQAGLVEIEAAVAQGNLPLNDLLNRVLETMQGVLQCRCIVFCLRDPGTGLLTGRFGLGPAASTVSAALRIDLAQARNGDLFAALCTRGADTLIADATTGPLSKKLPTWYRSTVNAPTFLLLPLLHKAAPFGLIYADMAQAGSFKVEAAELAVLKALRDQIVLVFSRKKGG
jgi:HD-like signal output (HDOD) protein